MPLYGTANGGGSFTGGGTVFKLNTDGSGFTVLKDFTNSIDGANPIGGLELSGATLYGTTANGGNYGCGTVFSVNTDGSGYTVLKYFAGYFGNDGANPVAALVLSGTTLYGTTLYGGNYGVGTVFKVNTDGSGYAVLKFFSGDEGEYPFAGLLLSGTTLYGTTRSGGSSWNGTVFSINTDGTGCTVLHSFTGSDGANPVAGLVLFGTTLYGTTSYGGSSGNGAVFGVNTNGTGFTVLKQFNGYDGINPGACVVRHNALWDDIVWRQ